MVNELDIFRSAHIVIKKCNSSYDPKEYAMFKMNQLFKKGDVEGAEVWMRITRAIDQINDNRVKGKTH